MSYSGEYDSVVSQLCEIDPTLVEDELTSNGDVDLDKWCALAEIMIDKLRDLNDKIAVVEETINVCTWSYRDKLIVNFATDKQLDIIRRAGVDEPISITERDCLGYGNDMTFRLECFSINQEPLSKKAFIQRYMPPSDDIIGRLYHEADQQLTMKECDEHMNSDQGIMDHLPTKTKPKKHPVNTMGRLSKMLKGK